MLFTSYEFIGFLIVTLILYYALPKKFQWQWLLISSLVFYYLCDVKYLIFILATALTIFLIAKKIQDLSDTQSRYFKDNKETLSKDEKKVYKATTKKKQWRLLLLALFINIGILAVLKYTNFAISNINNVTGLFGGEPLSFVNLVLPMGISFYTFQAVGYIIDVYRGTQKAQTNFFKFALFVSFFPQLVQGPISRFSDLGKTLYGPHDFDATVFFRGLQRVLWGYFKKLVIADRILVAVTAIIKDTEQYSGAFVFVGMIFYAIELYADFTGGIDITIGIAESMGITLKENFNRPFFSKNIKEYWNRWHITMGTWFTDYIFYPVSVCKPMLKISRFSRAHFGDFIGKRVPIYLSSFIVWFTTGIWHGASWNFIVWGLGNWVVIMVSQELEPFYRFFHSHVNVKNNRLWHLFQVGRTFLIMSALRTLDCYRDVPLTFRMFGTMFTKGNWGILFDGSLLNLGLSITDYVILFAGVIILISISLIQRKRPIRESTGTLSYPLRFLMYFGLFLVVLLFGAYGIGYDQSQFIYNQF